MGKLTATMNWFLRRSFRRAGLRWTTTDLGDGTSMSCWNPALRDPSKSNLLLIHGIGSNAMMQWNRFLPLLLRTYNVFVPDLVFFGGSYTTRSERSEEFQARCVAATMEALGVCRMSIIGMSYGGFVAYSVAAQFPEMVERVVLCCSGVAMEEKDVEGDGLLKAKSVDWAVELLYPRTAEKAKEMLSVVFHRPPRLPPCVLQDLMDAMREGCFQERTELIRALHKKGRTLDDLPKITQPLLILWGEYDQIFPVELGHRLKRHLDGNEQVEMVIIKDAGHALAVEKPKEMSKHLKAFLVDSRSPRQPEQ